MPTLREIGATRLIHASTYPYRLISVRVGRWPGLQQMEKRSHRRVLIVSLPDGIKLHWICGRGDDGTEVDVVKMQRLRGLRDDGSPHARADQCQHRVNLRK